MILVMIKKTDRRYEINPDFKKKRTFFLMSDLEFKI